MQTIVLLTPRLFSLYLDLYEGLKLAQRGRLEDQRGTEIKFEMPEFLKRGTVRHYTSIPIRDPVGWTNKVLIKKLFAIPKKIKIIVPPDYYCKAFKNFYFQGALSASKMYQIIFLVWHKNTTVITDFDMLYPFELHIEFKFRYICKSVNSIEKRLL